jgi:DEAD/DEAH box helicase domain-containing protein
MSDDPHTDTTESSPGSRRELLSEAALVETFPGYRGQRVAGRRLPAEPAETVPADAVLAEPLAGRLEQELFSHQAEALERLADGENVVVTTSTSSGKTWVYALQAARNHLADPDATALCLYPMKALTRDQEAELNDRFADWGVDATVGVYDGDTDSDRKRRVREEANLVLTNPAGLNVYLPRHNRDSGWHRFYSNLQLVVVDEAHQYSGVTGTHVAWILRRLRRLLGYYDADPQFVLTTATIGNPAEHARRLTGDPFAVVDDDGSPRGARDVVLWEPPVDWDQVDDDGDDPDADFERARASTGSEAASVTAHLAGNGVRTLQFCGARQGTEIAAKQIAEAAGGPVSVRPYHAGLGKRTRRAVENELKSGRLDAVATTSALELGIDIGGVDATVTAGYPGTKQSFWQQVGRAGRGRSDALSVLVGGEDAMDAYVLEHPDYLFDGPVEDAVVSIDNEPVYADHLLAAASERPLTREDAPVLGEQRRLAEMTRMWQEAGLLQSTGDLDGRGVGYAGDPRPQSRISMYATSGEQFEVVCRNGDIDHDPVAAERAYRDYHEGALFLHAGQQYRVLEVAERGRPQVHVEQVDTDRYTQTLSTKRVRDLQPEDHRPLAGGYDLYFGRGTVEVTYDRYLVREVRTGDTVEGPLPTGAPPMELETDVLWVALPEGHAASTLERLDAPMLQPTDRAGRDRRVPDEEGRYTYAGGLHAAEHGVIGLAPLELMIDSSDVGGLSTPRHPDGTIPGPVWFVHDGIDGGVGFTRAIYEHLDSILERTREHLAGCDCGRRRGCPLCVMSEHCGNNNDPLDRAAADVILGDVLEAIDRS